MTIVRVARGVRQSMRHRQFVVLWREFLAQFFASESATSDVQLRQTMMWVLAFILTPCLIILVQIFSGYQGLMVWARALHAPNGAMVRTAAVRMQMAEDMLEWIAFVLVTYSMLTVGLLAVFVWEALAFDRRDAMVLGPMPIRGATIIAAKLAALGTFLLASSAAVNLLNATIFAIETSDLSGAGALVRHFAACLTVTVSGATFVFASIVTIRSGIALVGGPRVAAAIGSTLQFLFVVALFSVVILFPSAQPNRFVTPRTAGALPPTWFVAAFEILRGSLRGSWPDVIALGRRALISVPIVVVAAVVTSVAAFRRQTQLALAPSASPGPLGGARLSRAIARWLVRNNPVAAATSDFVLTTIARNPRQQAPIAINAAIGIAMVLAGVARQRGDLASFVEARAIVLSVPLMLAFWTSIGLRAAFFVPSDLAASWSFHANAPARSTDYRAGVCASVLAFVGPPATLLAVAVAFGAGGWSAAVRHGAFVLTTVAALAELVAASIDFVPFTRAYRPGHARLKTRWPLYLLGAYGFSYGLVAIELRVWQSASAFLVLVASIAAAIAVFEIGGRRAAAAWSVEPPEEVAGDLGDIAVLDIGRVVHGAHVGG